MYKIIGFSLLALQCYALYSSNSSVIELDVLNFHNQVINSDKIWIVEFFTALCEHCQKLVPEYEKVGVVLKGLVHVGAVDLDKYKSLGDRFDIHGYPTIKIFCRNKNNPKNYKGEYLAKDIIDAILSEIRVTVNEKLEALSKIDVITLTDDTFDKLVLQSDDVWLIEFYAPWCVHCQKLAPQWEQAASNLRDYVKLGAIDATINTRISTLYKVQGYPTIKYFPAGEKTVGSVRDYKGSRAASDIVNWTLEKVAEDTTLEIVQILNGLQFKNICNYKPLCVLAFLPHIFDCQSECRNNYINILKEVGKKYKRSLWGWTWSEAGAQLNLEKILDIGGFGYPALVVINLNKMKFSPLRGAFSKTGIDEFFKDISYGRCYTIPIPANQFPNIIEIESWNGNDAFLPSHELQQSKLSNALLNEKEEL